jgi:protein-tyrosine-phosphatase
MSDKMYKVLFLCTGNSARSIMAEALVTIIGKGRFQGYRAGSKPGGTVNPFAIEKVKQLGYPPDKLRSKNSFVNLPIHMLGKHAIQLEVKKIGDTPVAAA